MRRTHKPILILVAALFLLSISCSSIAGDGAGTASVTSDRTDSPMPGGTSTLTPTLSPELTWTPTEEPIPHLKATYVAVGSGSACAITTTGGLVCWGSNEDGLLGNGTNTDSYTPVDVVGLSSGVVAIDVHFLHTCAVTDDGKVHCWGDGYNAPLGDGSYGTSNVPVEVVGIPEGVVDVVTGDSYACILTKKGGVKCWGWNYYGQLGDNSNKMSLLPVNVYGLTSGVQAIKTGDFFTCALTNGGAVKCWGRNDSGQLGDGKGEKYCSKCDSSKPVDVIGLSSGVIAIAAGSEHVCALIEDGSIKCWGENYNGQLGYGVNGLDTNCNTPVDVIGLTEPAIEIYTGSINTCAKLGLNTYKCWGYSNHNFLGDLSEDTQNKPIEVPFLSDGFLSISLGSASICGIRNDNSVLCWGNYPYEGGYGVPNDIFATPVYIPCPDCP